MMCRLKARFALLILALLGGSGEGSVICPDNETPVPEGYTASPTSGKYFKTSGTTSYSFKDGMAFCAKDGGQIATIKNEEEANVVKTLISRDAYIGLVNPRFMPATQPSDLEWIDGTPFQGGSASLIDMTASVDSKGYRYCTKMGTNLNVYIIPCNRQSLIVCEFVCSSVKRPFNQCPNGNQLPESVIRLTVNDNDYYAMAPVGAKSLPNGMKDCRVRGGKMLTPKTADATMAARIFMEFESGPINLPWVRTKLGQCDGIACADFFVDTDGDQIDFETLVSTSDINQPIYDSTHRLTCMRSQIYNVAEKLRFIVERCNTARDVICQFTCEPDGTELDASCPHPAHSINVAGVDVYSPDPNNYDTPIKPVLAKEYCQDQGGDLFIPKTDQEWKAFNLLFSIMPSLMGLPLVQMKAGVCSGTECNAFMTWLDGTPLDAAGRFPEHTLEGTSLLYSGCLHRKVDFTIKPGHCSTNRPHICKMDCSNVKNRTCPDGTAYPTSALNLVSGSAVFQHTTTSSPSKLIAAQCSSAGGEVFLSPRSALESIELQMFILLKYNEVMQIPYIMHTGTCVDAACDGQMYSFDGKALAYDDWADPFPAMSASVGTGYCLKVQQSVRNIFSFNCDSAPRKICRFECNKGPGEPNPLCERYVDVNGISYASTAQMGLTANHVHSTALGYCQRVYSGGFPIIPNREVYNTILMLHVFTESGVVRTIWVDLVNFAESDCSESACLSTTVRWGNGSAFDPDAYAGIPIQAVDIKAEHGDRIYMTLENEFMNILSASEFTTVGSLCTAQTKFCRLLPCDQEEPPLLTHGSHAWDGTSVESGTSVT